MSRWAERATTRVLIEDMMKGAFQRRTSRSQCTLKGSDTFTAPFLRCGLACVGWCGVVGRAVGR